METPIPFTIADYERLVITEATHEVRTVAGDSVRVLCTDGPDPRTPLIGVMLQHDFSAIAYTTSGSYYTTGSGSPNDLQLVPIPPESLGFVAIYESINGTFYLGGLRNKNTFGTHESFGKLIAVHEFKRGEGL